MSLGPEGVPIIPKIGAVRRPLTLPGRDWSGERLQPSRRRLHTLATDITQAGESL
jgi:hypothetical protein